MKNDAKPKKQDSVGERQAQLEEPLTLGEDVQIDGGRAGGNLNRDIGTKDHLKRSFERPAGKTRVEGEQEREN